MNEIDQLIMFCIHIEFQRKEKQLETSFGSTYLKHRLF